MLLEGNTISWDKWIPSILALEPSFFSFLNRKAFFILMI
jgi:hypothetical protein